MKSVPLKTNYKKKLFVYICNSFVCLFLQFIEEKTEKKE